MGAAEPGFIIVGLLPRLGTGLGEPRSLDLS